MAQIHIQKRVHCDTSMTALVRMKKSRCDVPPHHICERGPNGVVGMKAVNRQSHIAEATAGAEQQSRDGVNCANNPDTMPDGDGSSVQANAAFSAQPLQTRTREGIDVILSFWSNQ